MLFDLLLLGFGAWRVLHDRGVHVTCMAKGYNMSDDSNVFTSRFDVRYNLLLPSTSWHNLGPRISGPVHSIRTCPHTHTSFQYRPISLRHAMCFRILVTTSYTSPRPSKMKPFGVSASIVDNKFQAYKHTDSRRIAKVFVQQLTCIANMPSTPPSTHIPPS